LADITRNRRLAETALLCDVATLTLAHHERLDDVLAGYGTDVDRDRMRAWWSWRCSRQRIAIVAVCGVSSAALPT
jgi:hypothetical protein